MKKLLTGLITTAIIGTFSFSAQATEDIYNLKFQSSDNKGNANFILKQEWAQRVKTMSGGRINIEMLPAGSIVAHNKTLDAVGMGLLDGHITATAYFSDKDPAFGLIGNTVGAWSDPNDMLMYMELGGGAELVENLYTPYGVQFIGASATGLEAFVSKIPINGVADIKNLKLRTPEGLVQAVFVAAGAIPINLPGSDVYEALNKGMIDAADYSVFSTNEQQGMHKAAKHPVYPGFHSLPTLDVSMNKAKYDSMGEDLQEILKVSVHDFARQMVNNLKLADMTTVATVQARGDVTIHDWSAEERNKFRAIAMKEWAKYAKKSPNAEKVYQSITKYLSANGKLNQ